ncbi:MAG TPA: DoxX family protein [Gemmatimonadales bacterium]|nr:DoxX family protein [Gemmatimonadales bacterium]
MKKDWAPQLLSVLRIVLAYLLIQAAMIKLFGFPIPVPGSPSGTVPAGSLPWVAGLIEIIGGPLVLIGLFTRPVAFVIAGEMAVAYFYGHARMGHWLWPVANQGHAAVIFCFLFLYISAAGAGPWSLDAWLARRRRSTVPVS